MSIYKLQSHLAVALLTSIILAIANVHGYFKTETHFGSSWLGPHVKFPLWCVVDAVVSHHAKERLTFKVDCVRVKPA
jgi:hypothetical protein